MVIIIIIIFHDHLSWWWWSSSLSFMVIIFHVQHHHHHHHHHLSWSDHTSVISLSQTYMLISCNMVYNSQTVCGNYTYHSGFKSIFDLPWPIVNIRDSSWSDHDNSLITIISIHAKDHSSSPPSVHCQPSANHHHLTIVYCESFHMFTKPDLLQYSPTNIWLQQTISQEIFISCVVWDHWIYGHPWFREWQAHKYLQEGPYHSITS